MELWLHLRWWGTCFTGGSSCLWNLVVFEGGWILIFNLDLSVGKVGAVYWWGNKGTFCSVVGMYPDNFTFASEALKVCLIFLGTRKGVITLNLLNCGSKKCYCILLRVHRKLDLLSWSICSFNLCDTGIGVLNPYSMSLLVGF